MKSLMIGWLNCIHLCGLQCLLRLRWPRKLKSSFEKTKIYKFFSLWYTQHEDWVECTYIPSTRRGRRLRKYKIKQNWKCIINLFFFLLFYIILFLFRFLDDERRVKKCIYHLSCHNTTSNANFIIINRSSDIDILICRHNSQFVYIIFIPSLLMLAYGVLLNFYGGNYFLIETAIKNKYLSWQECCCFHFIHSHYLEVKRLWRALELKI